MTTPGLLPDDPEPFRSRLRWLPLAAGLGFAILATLLVIQIFRFKAERDRAGERIRELAEMARRPVSPAPPSAPSDLERRVRELEARLARLEAPPAGEAAGAPSGRAPDVRVAPEPPRDFVLLQANLWLAIRNLGWGEYRVAARCLADAMRADAAWLSRIRPREFFRAAPGEYEKLLAALEQHARQNPLDLDAKLMLAYFHFHEKGPGYAKTLLGEILSVEPSHAAAKEFLAALER